jgi:hypothetical protein
MALGINIVFGLLYFDRHNLDFRLDQDCSRHYILQYTDTIREKIIMLRAGR